MNKLIEAAVLTGAITVSCAGSADSQGYTSATTLPNPNNSIARVSTPEPPKPPEGGWKTFQSIHWPYQVDYPANWIYDASFNDVFLNNKHPQGFSSLNTAGVAITAIPVQSFVTLDAFFQQRFDSVKTRAQVQGSPMDSTVDGKPAKRLTYIYPPGYGSIADVDVNFSNRLSTTQTSIFVDEMLVLKDGRMYIIEFAADRGLIHGDNNPDGIFVKMFRSFKFR